MKHIGFLSTQKVGKFQSVRAGFVLSLTDAAAEEVLRKIPDTVDLTPRDPLGIFSTDWQWSTYAVRSYATALHLQRPMTALKAVRCPGCAHDALRVSFCRICSNTGHLLEI